MSTSRDICPALAHMQKFVKRSVGIVYKLPLACKKAYIGQSGRCLNERLKEERALCQQMGFLAMWHSNGASANAFQISQKRRCALNHGID